MRRRARPLLWVFLAAVFAAGVPAAQQQAVFQSRVDAVSVPVLVRNGNAPVTGLTAADFEVLDNGVPQKISAVSVEALPIDVTLLLHVSRSITGRRLEWLKASVVETAGLIRGEDRLRLIAVQHGLSQLVPFQAGGRPPALDGLTGAGGTSLYDGLAAAMVRAAEPDRRHLIVAFTTGVDTISILSLDAAKAIAGQADAVVHMVVPLPAGGGQKRSAMTDATPLGELAERTGGQLFWTDVDQPIAGAFTRAVGEFRTSYVLRYAPAGVAREGWHELTVRVKGGPYEVRARKGYQG